MDRLDDAAWALWYAAVQRGSADATASDAMLPASVVQAVNRSYAVLDATYAEIRPFALAMFRRESPEESFPSLFSVRAPRSARTAPEDGGTEDAEPTEDSES